MELGKLGTITDGEGNSRYDARRNPLLQPAVISYNPFGWGANLMNPDTYATAPAALAIAKLLNGSVVTDPISARFNASAKMLAVQLPDREPVNAGAICAILGNDCAFANERMKSGAICELLGLPYDPTLASNLYRALAGELA